MVRVPAHIAIIMDGNGRWAKSRGYLRVKGHSAGVKSFENIVLYCCKVPGVQELSAFALSRDNFKRSRAEIGALLSLFENMLENQLSFFISNDIRVVFVGDRSVFSDCLQSKMLEFEEATKLGKSLHVNLAVNYSGRYQIFEFMKNNKLPDSFEDASLEFDKLMGISAVDLLIRTSGEQRLSDFCLWQLAYSEIYFSNCFWPDFCESDLVAALEWYDSRDRRFGEVNE